MAWTSTTVPCTGFDITVYLPRPSAHHVTNTKPNSRVSAISKSTVLTGFVGTNFSLKSHANTGNFPQEDAFLSAEALQP
jgi:hypothetical protein